MALIECKECGKKVSDKASTCPNCGYQITVGGANEMAAQKTNGFAITGFVIGLVSMLIDPVGIFGTMAVVFSSIGLGKIKNNGQKGKGLAVTGLILGIVALVWLVIKIIYWEEISEML